MSHKKDNIKRLITKYERRLQKLREQRAIEGRSVDPKIPIEIEDIEAEIEELQTELKALESSGADEATQRVPSQLIEDTNPKQRIQIYLQGEISSLSAERRSSIIDALAGLLRIPPGAIEVYQVYGGSIVFDLGLSTNAVQRLRSLLQSNNAQLRLLKIEKVILERKVGEIEVWIIKAGKFHLVASTQPAVSSDIHRKSQRAKYSTQAKRKDSKMEFFADVAEQAQALFESVRRSTNQTSAYLSFSPGQVENGHKLTRPL